jgi:hypothetical protein
MATVKEHGVTFKTGKAVTFNFTRNTESSAKFKINQDFQQNIEPAGRYITHDYLPNEKPMPQWIKGKVSFKNPLVIKFNLQGNTAYDDHSWKTVLYQHFNKKKKSLTNAIKKLGHDGIVTVDKYGTSEIIEL